MFRTKSAGILVLVAAMSLPAAAQKPAAIQEAGQDIRPAPSSSRSGPATALPATPAAAFGSIHVTALSAGNSPLPRWIVRLRDARYGRLVSTNITDEAGSFTFRDVDPGSYIIELVGSDQTVRATSPLLALDAAGAVYAVVRLPTERGAIAALFGVGLAQAAALTMALAGSADVPPVQPTTPVSPR